MSYPMCQHCGEVIIEYRRKTYCSLICTQEAKRDRQASGQRIASFQALADAGTWRQIDNFVLQSLSNPHRRVKLLEKSVVRVNRRSITSYRLTDAGYKLLLHWQSQFISVA
jgi:hypothetical protein